MRRLNRSRTSTKADPYADVNIGEDQSQSSFVSYDDLFNGRQSNAEDDSIEAGWEAFEDDLARRSSKKGPGSARSTAKSTSRSTSKSKSKSRISLKAKLSIRSTRSSKSDKRSTTKSGRGTNPGSVFSSSSSSDDDEKDFLDEEDSVDSDFTGLSQTSFETMYGRKVFQNGDEDESDFEFSNPSGWADASAQKEAVFDVLSKGGTTEEIARKLYVLEQLNKKSPPSTAPSFWNRRSMLIETQKRRKLKGFYEIPNQDENGVPIKTFCNLTDLIVQEQKLNIAYANRVEILLEVAKRIGKFHQGGYIHGTVRSDSFLLSQRLGVHVKVIKTIRTLNKAEFRSDQRKGLEQLDILGLGIVIMELILGKTFAQISCPKLKSAVKLEEKGRYEKLDELADGVDAEVRGLLFAAGTDVPGSLIELCAQCISPMRLMRPSADDAIEWLMDLDHELQEAGAPDRVEVGQALFAEKKLVFKGVKEFDMNTVPDLGEEEEDGYETDDSYLPPDNAEESGGLAPQEKAKRDAAKKQEDKKKPEAPPRNKLQAFLQASGDVPHQYGAGSSAASVAGDVRARPRSMMLPTALNRTTSDEHSEPDPVADGAREAKKMQRRRSLDRGYLYAKQRFEETDREEKTRLTVSKANIGAFREQWKAKQAVINPNKLDPEDLGRRFEEQEILSSEEALSIIKRADNMLREEPNLIQLTTATSTSITIVGDIHGQYYDMRQMFKMAGQPGKGKGKTTFLFLGDFVDRGDWSCEVMLYLLALKIKFPAHVWLVRGNHEARTVSSYFGFKEECERKYGLAVFNRFAEMFQALPIAATVETPAGKWLCLHGGISPNVQTLDQFIEFDRFAEPAMNGFLCDILWADPVKDTHEDGVITSMADFLSIDFLPNPQRGCSYRYGFRAVVSFLAVNGLVGLIRAHEVQEEGYFYHYVDLQGANSNNPGQVTPPVITVFSAPNYTGRYGNKAAIMRMHHKVPGRRFGRKSNVRPMQLVEPIQYTAVPHPDPRFVENEQQKQTVRLETTCPYMPTTFHAFITRAIEFGEEEARRSINREAMRSSLKDAREIRKEKAMSDLPPPLPPRKVSDHQESDNEDNKPPSSPRKNWKAAALLGFDDPGGVQAAGPYSKPPPSPKKKKKKNKKFEEAAQQDGINELNPLVVQDKMKQAQVKLDPDTLHLPEQIRVKEGNGHESLIRKKSPAKKSRRQKNKKKSANENSISFSANELVSLQLLFLVIDHSDKGFITREDLVQWSAEDGYAVPRSEADLCLEYVDADRDGKIGFEDYLVFAARNKERWLVKQYNQVLGNIKKMERQGSTPVTVP